MAVHRGCGQLNVTVDHDEAGQVEGCCEDYSITSRDQVTIDFSAGFGIGFDCA